jgi:hypothetical protein
MPVTISDPARVGIPEKAVMTATAGRKQQYSLKHQSVYQQQQ